MAIVTLIVVFFLTRSASTRKAFLPCILLLCIQLQYNISSNEGGAIKICLQYIKLPAENRFKVQIFHGQLAF